MTPDDFESELRRKVEFREKVVNFAVGALAVGVIAVWLFITAVKVTAFFGGLKAAGALP